MSVLGLAAFIIAIALVFDYINGFHDAANSIATIVATRVLTPFQAVLWAAFFNFAAAFIFGTAVAKTIGKGFVDLNLVTPYVILCGLAGAILWDLLTWWQGLPTSSSHALIGGYAGAAMARAGILHGIGHSFDALRVPGGSEWPLTIAFIFLAPIIGLVSAYVLMIGVYWAFRNASPSKMDRYFRKFQLLSVAAAAGVRDPQVGAVLLVHGDRVGDAKRRMADCEDDGCAADAAETAERILRRNRRRGFRAAGHAAGAARIHDARHCRSDCGSRQHQPAESGAVGHRHQHRGSMGADHPDVGPDRRTDVSAVAHGWRSLAGPKLQRPKQRMLGPAATATYWRPAAMKVMGDAFMRTLVGNCQSFSPLR